MTDDQDVHLQLSTRIRNKTDEVLQESAALAEIEVLLQESPHAVDAPELVDLLGACCGRGWLYATNRLIDIGVPFRVGDIYAPPPGGFTCSHVILEAATAPDTQILELLVRRGACLTDISHPDGESAIHWAAYFECPHSIRWLLSRGLAVDKPTAVGETPLFLLCHLAVRIFSPTATHDDTAPILDCAKVLIATGADPDLCNQRGCSARQLVTKVRHPSYRQNFLDMFAAVAAKRSLDQTTPASPPPRIPGHRL